jgi:hypothetical protein
MCVLGTALLYLFRSTGSVLDSLLLASSAISLDRDRRSRELVELCIGYIHIQQAESRVRDIVIICFWRHPLFPSFLFRSRGCCAAASCKRLFSFRELYCWGLHLGLIKLLLLLLLFFWWVGKMDFVISIIYSRVV